MQHLLRLMHIRNVYAQVANISIRQKSLESTESLQL